MRKLASEAWMPKKRHAAEQIIGLLRQAEVKPRHGKTAAASVRPDSLERGRVVA
jgi:hypothetical protein